MTVEVIKAEVTVSHQEEKVKVVDEEVVVDVAESKKDVEVEPEAVEKTPSFKEESNFVSDLKDHEKKALTDLKAKLEEAILGNSLFKKKEPKVVVEVVEEKVEEVVEEKKDEEKIECLKEEEGEKVEEKPQEEGEASKKPVEKKGLKEAILGNSLFKKKEPKVVEEKVEVVEEKKEEKIECPKEEEGEKVEEKEGEKVVEEKVEEVVEEKKEEKIECPKEEEGEKVEEKPQEEGEASKKPVEKKGMNGLKSKIREALKAHSLLKKKSKKEVEEKEKPVVEEKECEELKPEGEAVVEEKVEEVVELVKTEEVEEKKPEVVAEVVKTEECEEKKPEVVVEEVPEVVKAEEYEEEKKVEEEAVIVDRDISLWGVPLLPSKADERTDVVLLKFLRARDFKVNEAFEMLKKTLEWRKEWNIDSILDEDLGSDLSVAAYMNGVDREGHPICYNILGVFNDEELYEKAFGSEEKCKSFLRWRFQLMESGIQKLELKPSGVTSLLQITDLRNSPPAKKEARLAVKQAVGLLQDNYPEFVARNIWINVPFWYYAFHAVFSTKLTQRTKSKDVVARPAKVTETLIKYIPVEEIPIQYGGLKRESDYEFSSGDGVAAELIIKASSTETIEIPAPEAGTTFIWDITVLGWEVNYKEEFIPTDEGSYTIIVQKQKKLGAVEGPVRNTYRTNEPGKIVLTIENCTSKKKKVFYRHKVKKSAF